LRHRLWFGLAMWLAAGSAAAQLAPISDDPQLRAEHDALFARVLKAPADAALSRRYAELAARMGDFEAGIGALERVVLAHPDDWAAHLAIGEMYVRLGALELARSAFERASAVEAPEATRARAAAFLIEIERRLQPTGWSFSGQTGLRWQSNANAAPSSPLVRALGFDTSLPNTSLRKPDWNAFVQGSLRLVHDLENQRGDTIEAQLTGYYARQFRLASLNAGVVEANLGPRLALEPDLLPGWSVRPYLLASGVTLGDAPFAHAVGAGVTLAIPLGAILVEPGYEMHRRIFHTSSGMPTAAESNGRWHNGFVTVSGTLPPGLRWFARLQASRAEARADRQAHRAHGFDAGVAYGFAVPSLGRKWTLAPFVGWTHTRYDAPDPLVDPLRRRRDREWRLGVSLDAPVSDRLGFGITVQLVNNRSTLPNYARRNVSVSFGPTLRF